MSKRAEEASLKAYPLPTLERITTDVYADARKNFQEGYERVEKDTIERAWEWMKLHTYTFNNMEEVDLYVDLFRKAMEEE